MSIVNEYIRATVISLEFLIILLVILLVLIKPEFISTWSLRLSDNAEALRYVALAPVTVMVLVFNDSYKLLFPSEGKKKRFQAWPEYWKFKIIFFVGLMYSVLFGVAGLMTWILSFKINESIGLVVFAGSVVGSFVVYVSIYLARIKVKELMIRGNT